MVHDSAETNKKTACMILIDMEEGDLQMEISAKFKKVCSIFCCLLLSTLLMALFGCADKKSEAADLMAEGSYQEALEIYSGLEQDEEVEKAMSECRYLLFLDYLKQEGGATYTAPDKSYTVSVGKSGENGLQCTYSFKTEESIYASMGQTLVVAVAYGDSDATLNASAEMNILNGKTKEKATGKLNLLDYTEGEQIEWDSISSETIDIHGNPNTVEPSLLSNNAEMIKRAVNGLESIAKKSGTEVTMADFGFANL